MIIAQKNIHIIVLAAGLSRRMGSVNKLLLPFQEHTIIAEVLTQLQATTANGMTIVLGHQKEAVKKETLSFSCPFVFNPHFEQGQSSSIQAGVNVLPDDVDGFLICLGDMPKISTSDYQKVIDDFRIALSKNDQVILRPFREKKPGHPVCFAKAYKNSILNSQENDGCRAVILENKKQLVKWNTDSEVYFFDIDTKAEYESIE